MPPRESCQNLLLDAAHGQNYTTKADFAGHGAITVDLKCVAAGFDERQCGVGAFLHADRRGLRGRMRSLQSPRHALA